MCKPKVKIEVGQSYRGLINGCIFTIVKEVPPPNKMMSGKYYLVRFKDDKPDVKDWERTRSETYLESLLIEPID